MGQWRELELASQMAPASCTSRLASAFTVCISRRRQCDASVVATDHGSALSLQRFVTQNNQDTDVWYVKPFWRKTWGAMNGVGLGALGATTFYGEFGQYNDQFVAGSNLPLGLRPRDERRQLLQCRPAPGVGEGLLRHRIGSAALWPGRGAGDRLRRHACLAQLAASGARCRLCWRSTALTANNSSGCKINQGFDDWDLFQVGGVIFF